jgi:hypothetical protein
MTMSQFETALQAGNLDVLKQLKALAGGAYVDAKVLAQAMINGGNSCTQYVIENNLYEPAMLEDEINKQMGYGYKQADPMMGMILKQDYEATIRWAIEHHADTILDNPTYHDALRRKSVMDQLESALVNDDTHSFENLLNEFFSVGFNIDHDWLNFLPAPFANAFRRNLRSAEHEDLAEGFECSFSPETKAQLLTQLLHKVMTAQIQVKHKVGVIAALIEHGATIPMSPELGPDFKQWAKENNCEDLLELENVRRNQHIHKVYKLTVCKATHTRYTKQELKKLYKLLDNAEFDVHHMTYQQILKQMIGFKPVGESNPIAEVFFNRYFDKIFPTNESFKYATKSHQYEPDIFQWICRSGQADIIKQSGTSFWISSEQLHSLVLDCAKANQKEMVEALIDTYADNFRPEFRFSKEETDAVDAINPEIAQRLKDAAKPKQGIFSQYLGFLGAGRSSHSAKQDMKVLDIDIETLTYDFAP